MDVNSLFDVKVSILGHTATPIPFLPFSSGCVHATHMHTPHHTALRAMLTGCTG